MGHAFYDGKIAAEISPRRRPSFGHKMDSHAVSLLE
jgi:hypothetical protein